MEYIIIVIVLGVVGFIVWASIRGGKLVDERGQKLKRAEAGKAKILSFKPVGFRGHGPQGEFQAFNFTLEVSNAYKAPYSAVTAWNVYPMAIPKVQEGNEVEVKIDAKDPNIIYPDIQDVEYSWSAAIMLRDRRRV